MWLEFRRVLFRSYKIFLIPDVECNYYARENFTDLAKNNYKNGYWNIRTVQITKNLNSLSFRHFVPLLFILYLLGLPLLMIIQIWFIIPLLLYFGFLLFFSVKISFDNTDIGLIPFVAITFCVLHISYGTGGIAGLAGILFAPLHQNSKEWKII